MIGFLSIVTIYEYMDQFLIVMTFYQSLHRNVSGLTLNFMHGYAE